MAGVSMDRFSGLIPRVPAALLPEYNATVATNCEFAYGELHSTKADVFIKNLSNAAASIYTDNGLTFYSWPFDVDAARSPMASDKFDRLYFTTPTDFRVTTRSAMTSAGGEPASSYRVGVPRPALAPTLLVSTTNALTNATFEATFHYEYSGTKYQEKAITLNDVKALEQWSYTPPASNYVDPVFDIKSGHYPPLALDMTPAQAVPVVRIVGKDKTTKAVVLDVFTSNSSLNTSLQWVLAATKAEGTADYTLTLTHSVIPADELTRAYAYTYVNTYGEEGPPSPPATITLPGDSDVDLSATLDTQTADYAPIKEIRVYRTEDGAAVDDYFYAGTITVLGAPAGKFAFADNVDAGSLNETISSTNSYAPNPLLRGLVTLSNGIQMAWKDNELHFSDAYRPWSYPPSYVKTFGDLRIVGAIAFGAAALVITTGKPFIISGISPDSMTDSAVNIMQAGVSKWAIADLDGPLVYASNDGIVMVTGGRASLDTSARYFTREVWRQKYAAGLDTMRFAVWDGRLVVFSSARKFTPFMIDMDEGGGAITELPQLSAACSFVSPLTDQFYFANGTSLMQFAGGADTVAQWASREMVMPSPVNFGIAQVVLEGAWSLTVHADGALIHTEPNLVSGKDFRLPSDQKHNRWVFGFEGTGIIKKLKVASSVPEFKKLP